MKLQILSYFFYFVFWLSGVIYASISNTDIVKDAKFMYEQSFEKNFKLSNKSNTIQYSIPTQHLPEITVIAKLPVKATCNAEKEIELITQVIDSSEELSDESDLSDLINLIEEIRAESEPLSNLTKYLPIAEIDSKAYNQRLISIIV